MKKNNTLRILTVLAVLVLIGGLLLLAAGFVLRRIPKPGGSQSAEFPLVYFQNPQNQGNVFLDEGNIVIGSARSSKGITGLTLWVDGAISAERSWETNFPESAVITSSWEPRSPGKHILTIKAVDKNGNAGQASIVVNAEAVQWAGEDNSITYFIQEGDTISSLSEMFNLDAEALLALNPSLDEEIIPGTGLVVPSMSEPSEESASVPETSTPDMEVDSPDPFPDSHESMTPYLLEDIPVMEMFSYEYFSPVSEIMLRMEILSLNTYTEYERLHCYAGAGESTPQWMPDVDGDQHTDESFESLGGGFWNISEHFSGDNAFSVVWQEDRVLPVSITCVGILDGGLESRSLGDIELNIHPEQWDGVSRRAVSSVDEGQFEIDYQVEEMFSPGWVWLDPDMTPPTDLRFGAYTIEWHYEPEADEEPIDGFALYLNSSFMWKIAPEERRTTIPPEWFHPPCGETYTFHLTAFRNPYPDGAESRPSEPLEQYSGDPPCERTVRVSFDTLGTTEWLGDFDSTDLVGPVYGVFIANGEAISFDGRCSGTSDCSSFKITPGADYSIDAITRTWGGLPSYLIVEIPPGEDLLVEYQLFDSDNGNPDDELCRGGTIIANDRLDEVHRESIGDDMDSNCGVHFSVAPAMGSTASGVYGDIPLPYVDVSKLTYDSDTNLLTVQLFNSGYAAFPGKDLTMVLKRNDGTPIGVHTEAEFVLFPLEKKNILVQDSPVSQHPMDVCVVVDPGNEVPEAGEGVVWEGHSWCQPASDLLIEQVVYDPQDDKLRIYVKNDGRGDLINRSIEMKIRISDGVEFLPSEGWWTGLDFPAGQTLVFEWPGIGDEQREMLKKGYSVILDQNDLIYESDESNNIFEVGGSKQLVITWTGVSHPYYPFHFRDPETLDFYFLALLEGVSYNEELANWYYGPREAEEGYYYNGNPDETVTFSIAGDESLYIYASAELEHAGSRKFLGYVSNVFEPDGNWGANLVVSDPEDCRLHVSLPSALIHSWSMIPPQTNWAGCSPWRIGFLICEVE